MVPRRRESRTTKKSRLVLSRTNRNGNTPEIHEDSSFENLNSWQSPSKHKRKAKDLGEIPSEQTEEKNVGWYSRGSLLKLHLDITMDFYRELLKSNSTNAGLLEQHPNTSNIPPVEAEYSAVNSKVPRTNRETIPRMLKEENHQVVNGIYDHLEIRPSRIHGNGIFTNVGIPSKTLLMCYEGEIIGKCVSDKREKSYISHGIKSVYMFKVDEDKIIDATMMGNKARYINHSCIPNCYSITDSVKKTVLYFTKRKVMRGEELTIDYNYSEKDVNEICNCGSRRCRDRKA